MGMMGMDDHSDHSDSQMSDASMSAVLDYPDLAACESAWYSLKKLPSHVEVLTCLVPAHTSYLQPVSSK